MFKHRARLLAALLYLGPGLGPFLFGWIQRARSVPAEAEASVAGAGWLWFGGAIFSAGIIGPVLLMTGLTRTPAASASLLLNLEGVLTALPGCSSPPRALTASANQMFSQYADAPSAGLVDMHARTIIVPLLLTLSVAWPNTAEAADTSEALVLERTIPLNRVSGRIDHMAVDLGRQRLAVAELGNNTVDLIDLNGGRAIHRISGLPEPQGIAFVPSSDLFAVASAGDGSVTLFHASDFSPAGAIDLGDDADNVRVDRKTENLVVGYGEGGLAVIDSRTHSKISDIALKAHPEGFQLAPAGGRAFVNVPDAQEIATVDLVGGRQTASWTVPKLQSNFPMAVDGAGQILGIAFRGPARLALLNAADGTVIASAAACGDADDVFFDERRGRVYVSCGAGAVDVFGLNDLRHITQVKTHRGARTALFVPALDRLFVASPSSGAGDDAKILVFRPSS